MNRSRSHALSGLVLSIMLTMALAGAARAGDVQHFPGVNLSLFSSNVTALSPLFFGNVSTTYGDVWGGALEWDGLFKPTSPWGYYVGGAYGTGSDKETDASGDTFKRTINTWNLQGGPLWTALMIKNWYLGYGPALEYSSSNAKFEATSGGSTSSVTAKNFNSVGLGGHFMFGASCKGIGLQGSISNFVGRGSGTDGGAKAEEITLHWEYGIGLRYTF